ESASALPQSKSARQALLMDLAKLGIFPNPQDLRGLLEVPQLSNFLDKQMGKADENAAQRENNVFRELAKMPDGGQQYIDAYYQGWEQRQASGDPETMQMVPATDPATGAPIPGTEKPVPLAAPGVVPVNEWDDHAVHI